MKVRFPLVRVELITHLVRQEKIIQQRRKVNSYKHDPNQPEDQEYLPDHYFRLHPFHPGFTLCQVIYQKQKLVQLEHFDNPREAEQSQQFYEVAVICPEK